MRLKYYGTGAAEGIPGLFCDCDVCNYARAHRGKDIRTRSQAAIDDKLLIDFPPDTYMHVLYGGLNLSKIHSCIVTHNHSDHLYPADIEMRRNGFAYPEVDSPLTFYCSPKTSEGIKEINFGSQELASTTEEQSASIETIVTSAQNLSDMAENLQSLVGKFKLR